METKIENKNVSDELLNLAAELSEKQSHVVKGLAEFMKKWKTVTADKLGDGLDEIKVYENRSVVQNDGFEVDVAMRYSVVRGESFIKKRAWKTPDREEDYIVICNENDNLKVDEIATCQAIRIARNLQKNLTDYIAKLKARGQEYGELAAMLNKLSN
ncbi:MAG: hypothetical protein ACYCSQ_07550 [bacterium]